MGEVVRLAAYVRSLEVKTEADTQDTLVPLEFAVGLADRNSCIAKLADYGLETVHIRQMNNEPDTLLYLISLADALWLNKKILEKEDLAEDAIAFRIDLIQMLENINIPMMQSLWNSFTRQGG